MIFIPQYVIGRRRSLGTHSASDGSESEIRETIFCGLWRVRHSHTDVSLTDQRLARVAPLTYGKRPPIRCLTTLCCPPVAGLMNDRRWPMSYWRT